MDSLDIQFELMVWKPLRKIIYALVTIIHIFGTLNWISNKEKNI